MDWEATFACARSEVSPLWHERNLFRDAVCIETKVIREGRWEDDWKSAFDDLHRKNAKPRCDHLLAGVYGYQGERKRLRRSQKKRSYHEFAKVQPGEPIRLNCGPRVAAAQEGPRVKCVARWPDVRESGGSAKVKDGMVKLPPIRWGGKDLAWSNETYLFLILLARA